MCNCDSLLPGQPEGPGARHRAALRVPRARNHLRAPRRHQAEGAGQIQVSSQHVNALEFKGNI